jgi:hypothetical protein
MTGCGLRETLLASCSVAALLIGGGTSVAFAACINGGGGYNNTGAISCIQVTDTTFTGKITNKGTISPGGITFTGSAMTGSIQDSGPLIAGGISLDSASKITSPSTAILITGSTFLGGITNSGKITAGGNGSGIAVGGVSTFAGGISNRGMISIANTNVNVGVAGISVYSDSAFTGGITNSGTISATGENVAGILVQSVSTFAGGISNSGIISAVNTNAKVLFFGIEVYGDSAFTGGITNSGTISAGPAGYAEGIFVETVTSFAGGITNTGRISVEGHTGVGILVDGVSNFSGGITNSGFILATNNPSDMGGILATGFSTFLGGISNSGTIVAGYGIVAQEFTTFSGGITNSGNISAYGHVSSFTGHGIEVSNGTNFSGGILNSGTITAALDGIAVGFNSFHGGTVSTFSGGISNSGKITAAGAGIFLGLACPICTPTNSNFSKVTVSVSSFSGGITNSGTITGKTGIVVADVANFSGAIANSGVITGTGGTAIDVSTGNGNGIAIDQLGGTISGAIKLSANADVVNIFGGAINGNIVGKGSSDAINFTLGSGTFTYGSSYGFSTINQVTVNSGTVILDGANSATNVTVAGGTLEVGDASNPSATLTSTSPVLVAGTLAGYGAVIGGATIESGGTLAPGDAIGTLSIIGALTFNSGSYYAVQIAPGAGNNSKTAVTGGATLNGGTVVVTPELGKYNAVYQIITTTTGVTGTFASATPIINGAFSGTMRVDYATNSPNDVDLDVVGSSLLPTPPVANQNQQNVVSGINNAILELPANTMLPSQFENLGNLSGTALLNALNQLYGEVATGAEQSAFQLTIEFLNLMLDPFVNGRGNVGGSGAGGNSAFRFAPDQQASLPPDIALAYASILGKAPPQSFDQRWSAWGGAFGASSTTSGDPTVGSHDITAGTYGFAAGMDYHVSPSTIVGFALAGAGTNWGLSNGLGSGYSEALQIGTYGITWFGPAYLAAALSFSNHWFTTNRSALGDQLTANFVGQSYGARFEGGYRVPVWRAFGVTPYGALQAQDFQTPSYSETDTTGGALGLSYNAMNATDVRTELGARFDDPTLLYGRPLILFGRLAWAHDFVSNPALSAAFEALPGSTFTVNGAPIPQNSALTTAGAQYFLASNWSVIAKFDGEFAPGAQTYGGSGTLRYSW